MAKNSGRALEELVAAIERALHPQQFQVKTRQQIRDEDGNQLAELDIEIVGTVGTLPYRALIECRDRPSDGKQGPGWIEQLAGRRARFGLNQVVAVSTTGFTPAAIELGKQSHIILRHVKAVSDIGSDFSFQTRGGFVFHWICIKSGTEPRMFSNQPLSQISGLRKLRIRKAGVQEFSDFPECTLGTLQQTHPDWFEVGPDVLEELEWDTGPVDLLLQDGQVVPLTSIRASLTFQKKCFEGQAFQIAVYMGPGAPIGYIADFATKTPLGEMFHTVFTPIDEEGSEKRPLVLDTRLGKT